MLLNYPDIRWPSPKCETSITSYIYALIPDPWSTNIVIAYELFNAARPLEHKRVGFKDKDMFMLYRVPEVRRKAHVVVLILWDWQPPSTKNMNWRPNNMLRSAQCFAEGLLVRLSPIKYLQGPTWPQLVHVPSNDKSIQIQLWRWLENCNSYAVSGWCFWWVHKPCRCSFPELPDKPIECWEASKVLWTLRIAFYVHQVISLVLINVNVHVFGSNIIQFCCRRLTWSIMPHMWDLWRPQISTILKLASNINNGTWPDGLLQLKQCQAPI